MWKEAYSYVETAELLHSNNPQNVKVLPFNRWTAGVSHSLFSHNIEQDCTIMYTSVYAIHAERGL